MQFLLFALGLGIACTVIGLVLSASIRVTDFVGNKICDRYGVSDNPATRGFWLQEQFGRLFVKGMCAAGLIGALLILGQHSRGA